MMSSGLSLNPSFATHQLYDPRQSHSTSLCLSLLIKEANDIFLQGCCWGRIDEKRKLFKFALPFLLTGFNLKTSWLRGRFSTPWATPPTIIFGSTGFWAQGFIPARQLLYHLSHISNPHFCFVGSSWVWIQDLMLLGKSSTTWAMPPASSPYF
jgi:hypothetical protein